MHIAGDVIEIGDSGASTCSEPSGKSQVTATENTATNLGTPDISLHTVKSSELQLNKTETNSVKKPEDQNISGVMPAGSPVFNTEETFSSGLNLTSNPPKTGEISKAVNFPQATLVSPVPPILYLNIFSLVVKENIVALVLLSLRNICFCLSRLWWDLRQHLA